MAPDYVAVAKVGDIGEPVVSYRVRIEDESLEIEA